MDIVENLILAVHVLAALGIIGLVLIQQGKGAEMGSGFGSGASGTVFGSAGAGNFLSRTTTIAIAIFFITSLTLAYFASQKTVIAAQAGIPIVQEQTIPATVPADEPVDMGADNSDSELPEL